VQEYFDIAGPGTFVMAQLLAVVMLNLGDEDVTERLAIEVVFDLLGYGHECAPEFGTNRFQLVEECTAGVCPNHPL
jgi:hypothetical protein